jgi:hypothetical protein
MQLFTPLLLDMQHIGFADFHGCLLDGCRTAPIIPRDQRRSKYEPGLGYTSGSLPTLAKLRPRRFTDAGHRMEVRHELHGLGQ